MNYIIQIQEDKWFDWNWRDIISRDNLDDAMESYNRIKVVYRTKPTRLVLIMDSENRDNEN